MSDDKSNRSNPDRQRIDINDADEVRNWCKSFGVTPDELKAAVAKVGPMADKVSQELRGVEPPQLRAGIPKG